MTGSSAIVSRDSHDEDDHPPPPGGDTEQLPLLTTPTPDVEASSGAALAADAHAPGVRLRTPTLRQGDKKFTHEGRCRPCSPRGRGRPGQAAAVAAASFWWARARWAAETVVMAVYTYAFVWVFHNPWCGVIFQCGCTFNWAGGWTNCNVHNPTGPHCAWCAASKATVWTVDDRTVQALMMIGWATAAVVGAKRVASAPEGRRKALRRRWAVIRTLVVPALIFILHGIIVGGIFVAATGYPRYFWMHFPDTQDTSRWPYGWEAPAGAGGGSGSGSGAGM